ncbi:type IV secretion system oncogenic effector CagA [Helicobacter pylori]|uniref:Type IV secretion system oncogenic effector CagA n=2 Tax=Helicobacter pylori TaxID=210 RepID=A0AAE7TQS8_HELPX|nr:type IV secretion system oncogenic effector CagA [Helicobacter pylori]QQW93725.1 type IV secretion system oncogenic effector CagA [Helicobacter pylori]QQX49691.1 type IV secretion system oncogenic effector CagA [Helicobacter pylori]
MANETIDQTKKPDQTPIVDKNDNKAIKNPTKKNQFFSKLTDLFALGKKQSSDLEETLNQEPRSNVEQNIATTTNMQGLPQARDLLDGRGNFPKFTLGDMEMLDVEGIADIDPNYKFSQLLVHSNVLSSMSMGSHSNMEPEKVSLLYGDNGGPEARHDWNATVGYKNQQGNNVATLINMHLKNGSGLVIAGNEGGINNPSFYLYKKDQLTGLEQALSQEEIQNKVDFMEFLAQNSTKLDNLSEKEKEKFQTEIGNFQKDPKAYLDTLGSDHIAFVSKKDNKHLALVTDFGNGELSYTLKDYGKEQDRALDRETKTTFQGNLKDDGVMFVNYSNFKYTNASKSPNEGIGATNGVSHLEANFSKVAIFNLPKLNGLVLSNHPVRQNLEDKVIAKGLSPKEANKLVKDFLNSNKELVGKVSSFNKAVAEAKNTGNYDGVKKAQKDLEKSIRKREHLEKEVTKKIESKSGNKNKMEAKAQANSQKDEIFALINQETHKEARNAAHTRNLEGIRGELSDKIENINKNLKDFNKSFDALKSGKNKDFSKVEETLKALKSSVKDLGINPEWISKVENLSAALNEFKNGKNKDFSKVTQAKSDLENSIKDVIINQKITDKVDNLNQAVLIAKTACNFSGLDQALADLKNFSTDQKLDQKNESFNVGKDSDLQKSVKNGVNGTLVGNGLSKTEAATLTRNISGIKKELNEKFANFNNNNGLKNSAEPIYAQVNKKKTGQVTSPEGSIYDQVAKEVNEKINRLNEKASASKGVGDFSGLGRLATRLDGREPIYVTIDDLGGPYTLKMHAGDDNLRSKVGLSREQELTQKISNLNQAVLEAKASSFCSPKQIAHLEQAIQGLKDSTKKNVMNLWVEDTKKVSPSLQAKLDNYATNSHIHINSNVKNGAINEKATGMLTQKNPEWLKLVNDKIVAHNVGSAPLSDYDKIGFNQKNMKGYSDSFKFSTKFNNAVKNIKSGFEQFLTDCFSTGSYSPKKAEYGVTKSGFQKS